MNDHRDETDADVVAEVAPVHGLLAEYESTGDLVAACKKVRDAGYSKWDTYTPFPVHGIDRAMGIRMTGLPWIVFICAMVGLTTAVLLQWWTNAVDYPFISSGKPFWSIPANVPIYFELTVLLSAFGALFGMLALNRLPHPSHPLDLKKHFRKSTDDRFFLYVEAADAKYDEDDTRKLLEKTHPASLETVHEDRVTPETMPKGIVYVAIVLAVASLVPFAWFAKARATKTETPRIQAVADMDWQAKFKAQQPNAFYSNNMAMRAPEPGTVAIGELRDDDHLYRGKVDGAFARTFPQSFPVNAQAVERGRERYNIYCAPCHGRSGNGDGIVAQRAMALAEGTWVPPTVLAQDYLRLMPVGQLFDTITNGIRNMPPYGPQISAEDRWAIVLYVRALQHSKGTNAANLTDAEKGSLK